MSSGSQPRELHLYSSQPKRRAPQKVSAKCGVLRERRLVGISRRWRFDLDLGAGTRSFSICPQFPSSPSPQATASPTLMMRGPSGLKVSSFLRRKTI